MRGEGGEEVLMRTFQTSHFLSASNHFDLSRKIRDTGVPAPAAVDLSQKLNDSGLGDGLGGILGDVELLNEERAWRKAISTVGAKVRHEKEGWEGTVVRPATSYGTGAKVLVEHDFRDGDVVFRAQRFYDALALDPA
jgi:hypothetical protein